MCSLINVYLNELLEDWMYCYILIYLNVNLKKDFCIYLDIWFIYVIVKCCYLLKLKILFFLIFEFG